MSDYFISRDQAESDLLGCSAFLAERIRSSDGHAEAMNVIVPLYLNRGEVDLAAELANAVDDPFSRDKLLIEVAAKCAEIDDTEYALQLAEAIDEQSLRSQALERLGLIFASQGKAVAAQQVSALLDHPEFVQVGLAVNAAASGLETESRKTIEEIDFPGARVTALLQIGSAKIDAGDSVNGVVILQDALEATGEIEHDEERLRALCEIGNAFIDAKAFDRVIETFDKVRTGAEQLDNRHRDFFLVSSAIGFLSAGSVDLADRALDLVTDKTQMASAMVGYARHFWGSYEKQDAEDALEEAYLILKSQRENETRDSRARIALFTTLATQFVAYGKTQRGIEVALENPDQAQKTTTLAHIAQILTSQGDDEQANDTLNMIEEDSDRLYALLSMSVSKRRLNDDAAAARLLGEALELAEAVPQVSARAEVLGEIAARFSGIGDITKARAAAVESLATLSLIRDESSRAAALANLAVIYNSAGMELGEDERNIIGSLAAQAAV